MRRKTVRALANLGRAAAFAGIALAVATWWAWDSGWLRDLQRPAQRPRVDEACAEAAAKDGAAAAARLASSMLERLGPVRVLDRDAGLAADAREALANALQSLGDSARLEQVLDEALAVDPNDLVAEARQLELRSARADRTAAALERMRQLVQMAPTPAVTAPFVRTLVRTGRHQEAFDVLDAAFHRPFANDWQLALQPREGIGEAMRVTDSGSGQRVRLAFFAPPSTHAVRLSLPAFASGELTQLRIGPVGNPMAPVILDRAVGANALLALASQADGVVAAGAREAAFTAQLPCPFEGPSVVEATITARLPQALAQLTLLPAFAAWARALPVDADARRQRVLAWRRNALHGLLVGLACDDRAVLAAPLAGAGADVVVSWPIADACSELRFDLPRGRVCLPLTTLDVVVAGVTHTIGLTTQSGLGLQDVEATPAGFVVTGERPQIRVRHGLAGALQSITLRGTP